MLLQMLIKILEHTDKFYILYERMITMLSLKLNIAIML